MADFKHLDQLLERFTAGSVPGVGCAVAQDGKILYEKYCGYADIEAGRPITEQTLFRLYSMTKVVTCTAAMMLFERGKFLLTDPLYEYFPEYRHVKKVVWLPDGNYHLEPLDQPLLVKHAFTMACGLPYRQFGESPTAIAMRKAVEALEKNGPYDIIDEVKAVAQAPLAFEPGSHWLYGYGHEIVAALIKLVSGMEVSEFEQKEIFEPLGMQDTGYRFCKGDAPHKNLSQLACLYRKKGRGAFEKKDGLEHWHQEDSIYEPGGAGLFSTVRDYTKFAQMLACGGVYGGKRIIGRKTIDLMRQNQLNDAQLQDFYHPYNAGYGYGLGVRTMMDTGAGNANGSVGEFGWTGMLGTYASIDPSERLSIVYMHQMDPNEEMYHHLRVRAAANGCIR